MAPLHRSCDHVNRCPGLYTCVHVIQQAEQREVERLERERENAERQQQKQLAVQRKAEKATRKRLEKEARDSQKAQALAEQDAFRAAAYQKEAPIAQELSAKPSAGSAGAADAAPLASDSVFISGDISSSPLEVDTFLFEVYPSLQSELDRLLGHFSELERSGQRADVAQRLDGVLKQARSITAKLNCLDATHCADNIRTVFANCCLDAWLTVVYFLEKVAHKLMTANDFAGAKPLFEEAIAVMGRCSAGQSKHDRMQTVIFQEYAKCLVCC